MKRLQTDKFLIKEAKKGNQKAFNILFSCYYLIIYNYINSIVKNSTEAEDLTMITFEKAFSKIKEYAPLFEFGTWLSRIAKNTYFDYFIYKKRRPYPNVDLEEAYNLASAIENPEEQLISKQEIYRIENAITNLPFTYKNIIDMRYKQELSYQDIANKLNVSINKVAGQVRYTRVYLNKILQEKEAS